MRPSLTPGPATAVALAAAGAALAGAAGLWARGQDPLRQATSAASRAESYAFEGTTSWAGEAGTGVYLVAGTGGADGALELGVASSTAPPGASVDYRIHWPEVLDGAGRPVEKFSLGSVLPAGDPLGLVAAGHAAREGAAEHVDGRLCRRVDFLVAAPSYAAWRAAHPRHLPANADRGGLDKLSAEGTLWLDSATRLPCRVRAIVVVPPRAGDPPGEGAVDWTYRAWVPARGETTRPHGGGSAVGGRWARLYASRARAIMPALGPMPLPAWRSP
jgi:hypothetical protein